MEKIKVGVVGFSDEKKILSESQVTSYLYQGLKDLDIVLSDNIEIVSGLTNMGVPKLAYEFAKENNFKTVGISAKEALKYDCFPVDLEVIEGDHFGDESNVFLRYCDYLIKIGGGYQSINEYKKFKGKKVEYDLNEGTYVGVKLSENDNKYILDLCKTLEIPNPIEEENIHITQLYSRKVCKGFESKGRINEKCRPNSLEIFDSYDGKRVLVLKVDSYYLKHRFNELMNKYNAIYDYEKYNPHITLSYDVGDDFKIPLIDNIRNEFIIEEEYHEDLNLEW